MIHNGKLIPEVKAKWLVALRSSEFYQGQQRLRMLAMGESHTYCCLGVLCEVFHRETGRGNWTNDTTFRVEDEAGVYYSDTMLPEPVVAWAFGLDTVKVSTYECNPAVTYRENRVELAELNDGKEGCGIRQHNFLEIAAFIEKGL